MATGSKVLELGPTPLANSFLALDDDGKNEISYPLDVYSCEDCGLLQLIDIVSPEVLFRDYIYVSGTSDTLQKHFASMAASLKDPINLSIGQPDFDVPAPIKKACLNAIEQGKNAYAPTHGIGPLRERLQSDIDRKYEHADRKVFVSSGTSGGLVLSMLAMVDPGDEVIVFDPYFVMYVPLIQLVGGVPVLIDTYPDFRIDLDKVRDAITPKTKMVLFNSPGNPTGVTATLAETEGLAKL